MLEFLVEFFEYWLYYKKDIEYTPCGFFEYGDKTFYLYSRTHETGEPHFHVYSGKGKHLFKNIGKNRFHACISLIRPCYYDHGFKNGKFTQNELKAFCEFLNTKPKSLDGRSYWEFIVTLWDPIDKENDIYVNDVKIPDYSRLN